MEKRMERAKWEYSQAYQYDYLVVNDTVGHAAAELLAIMTAEKCKMMDRIHCIKEMCIRDRDRPDHPDPAEDPDNERLPLTREPLGLRPPMASPGGCAPSKAPLAGELSAAG